MNEVILTALLAPLFTSLLLLFFGGRLARGAISFIACLGPLVSFALFLGILIRHGYPICHISLYDWIHVGDIKAGFDLCLDPLSLLMGLIITGVGFLIHVYSIGYMDHDKMIRRYFTCMNFFVFSMLLLVLAGDLLLLFVGWEGVGVASYLLIGFWYEKIEAGEAAVKAFVVNRVGDMGLLLGILLTFYLFKTTHLETIEALALQGFPTGGALITLLTLLYFVGAMGKSAQLPLQTWLPDAMSGPTPVSALIHAATMVTAGVYLVVRMHPVFSLAPETLTFIGIVGSLTALYASLAALSQVDLKRVLAYSTVSQLGLMFMACGAGAFYSAMFHLTSHAFIKALLFLSAGNVLHSLGGETLMKEMGGLSKVLGKTSRFFLLGVLALSGIPPFAAFFSKDLILEQESLSGHKVLFYIALIASALTAFYLMRAYLLTFQGELKEKNRRAKEAPGVMLLPVAVLALLSAIGGFLGFTFHQTPLLEGFLDTIGLTHAEAELDSGFVLTAETWVSILGGVLGLAMSLLLFRRGEGLQRSFETLKRGFYFDELYQTLLVTPLKWISGRFVRFWEPVVFEGSVKGLSKGAGLTALSLQKLQSGQVRSYIAFMLIGMGFLLIYMII